MSRQARRNELARLQDDGATLLCDNYVLGRFLYRCGTETSEVSYRPATTAGLVGNTRCNVAAKRELTLSWIVQSNGLTRVNCVEEVAER